MAIVIEEEKKGGVGIMNVITWLVVIGAVVGTVYYVFFKKPDILNQVAAPAAFQNTEQLSKINLKPEDVAQNPKFTSLKYIPPIVLGQKGKTNPFASQ